MKEINLLEGESPVLRLNEDTRITVTGTVMCKAIHCLSGCTKLVIIGNGKLIMRTADEFYISIGRPPYSTGVEDVMKLNLSVLYINISCKEIEFSTSDHVQWLGNYGSNNLINVNISATVTNGDKWKTRTAAFSIIDGEYIGCLKPFVSQVPNVMIGVFDTVMKFFKDSGVNTRLFNDLILGGKQNVKDNFLKIMARSLVYGRKFKSDYVPNLVSDLMIVDGSVLYMYSIYGKFYNKTLDRDLLLACYRVCHEYEKEYFPDIADKNMSARLASVTLSDKLMYNIFGTIDAVAAVISDTVITNSSDTQVYADKLDTLPMTDKLEEAIKIVKTLGGDWE